MFVLLFMFLTVQGFASDSVADKYTEAHNVARKAKDIPPLVWCNTLQAYAQDWADHLANTNDCKMEHSVGTYGENLAWTYNKSLDPDEVVGLWLSEESDYDYKSNSCKKGKSCGHFTQALWTGSKKLGCGSAVCGKSQVFVCSYDPPGNYRGQWPW